MLKKISIITLFLVALLSLTGNVFAFEGASLENQTTFDLYDGDDPLDIALDPGTLYKIDKWRLYTNLSNYEEETGAYYMLGTSGKVGPGSLALFFEMNKSVNNADESEYTIDGTQRRNPSDTNPMPTVPNMPGYTYTGTNNTTVTTTTTEATENETSNMNLHLSYGMDFGMFSAGLAYAPNWEDTTQSLWLVSATGGNATGTFAPGNLWGFRTTAPGTGRNDWNENITIGNGETYVQDTITYGTTANTLAQAMRQVIAESFTGTTDQEGKDDWLILSSEVRPMDKLTFTVSLGYNMIDMKEDATATYSYSDVTTQTGADDGSADEFGVLTQQDGYLSSDVGTYTWNGAFYDGDRDGNAFQISVDPTYVLNDRISLEVELSYVFGSGDVSGDYTETVHYVETRRANAGANAATDTLDEYYDNSYSGDWDSNEFAICPRIYLNVGKTEFALGLDYMSEKLEQSRNYRRNATTRFVSLDADDTDGNAVAGDSDDYTVEASYTGYINGDFDETTTTLAFPVATRFNITQKLVLRAGAKFTRETVENDTSWSGATMENETTRTTNGEGTVSAQGPEVTYPPYTLPATQDRSPYDADDDLLGGTDNSEVTTDTTEYHLGFGYQATDNLKLDVMFKSGGNDGGVDLTEVFASAVLAF